MSQDGKPNRIPTNKISFWKSYKHETWFLISIYWFNHKIFSKLFSNLKKKKGNMLFCLFYLFWLVCYRREILITLRVVGKYLSISEPFFISSWLPFPGNRNSNLEKFLVGFLSCPPSFFFNQITWLYDFFFFLRLNMKLSKVEL